MKLRTLCEAGLAITLILLMVLLLNPFHFWMPTQIVITLVAGSVVVFGMFIAFVWRESALDEREGAHKAHAGWYAYLAGTSVLMVGIAAQSFDHAVDPWLVSALGIMLLAKMGACVYADRSL